MRDCPCFVLSLSYFSREIATTNAQLDARHQPETRGFGNLLSIDALDKRTRPFKRYETIRAAVLSDMGGEANVGEIQRQLISKFATLALQLEVLETAAIEGKPVDLDLFGRCAGHLRRIAETLGLKRVPRDVTPTLDDIAREIEAEREAAA
jgi:hypothetical protein